MALPPPTEADVRQARGEVLVGRGSFREVWTLSDTHPWVYKYPLPEQSDMPNIWEHGFYLEGSETVGVRMPISYSFNIDGRVVLAAERIEYRRPPHHRADPCNCESHHPRRWEGCWVAAARGETFEIFDVFVDDDGYLVPIDMGQ